eukprot:409735-Amorphochlora_amoeboformis.AAC.1
MVIQAPEALPRALSALSPLPDDPKHFSTIFRVTITMNRGQEQIIFHRLDTIPGEDIWVTMAGHIQ